MVRDVRVGIRETGLSQRQVRDVRYAAEAEVRLTLTLQSEYPTATQ